MIKNKKGRIRGYYDGTDPEEIEVIVKHIKRLNEE